jgi:hypothetical protein
MVKLSHLFMIIKMSVCEKKVLQHPLVQDLTQSLRELIQSLIENIQSLYYADSLNTANLEKSIKSVLTRFCEKKEIKQIDIFAILNSLRKNSPVLFEMNSTRYSFHFFLGETTLTIGNSSNIITINSKLIIERLEIITSRLTPIQKDFIHLMYLGLYKRFIPIEFKENFDMSCDSTYDFYMSFYLERETTWEQERTIILQDCKNLVFRRIGTISKNQYNYYRDKFTPPESLVQFRTTTYIDQLYNPDELQLKF